MTEVRTCRDWTVISGGPSREHIRQEHLLPHSPVVTVNRAVDVIDKGITVDFACFADPPAHLAKVLDLNKYLQPPIQVWCPVPSIFHDNGVMNFHNMVQLWEPHLAASVGIRTTPTGIVTCEDGKTRRHIFALLAALERVMMFRPEKVRVLSADMMGTWIPGESEEFCEHHQSILEQTRRTISGAQKRLTASKGQDRAAAIMLRSAQIEEKEMLEKGDPHLFKRWAHERYQLKEFQKRAEAAGATIEWITPEEGK